MKDHKLSIFPNFNYSNKENKDAEVDKNGMRKENNSKCSPIFNQTLVALCPFLLIIMAGMTFGYSAILLPQLKSGVDSSFSITKEEERWIASLAAVPMVIGCALCGISLGKLGRKVTHSIMCLPMCVGWLVLFLAQDVSMIFVGRSITGLVTGMVAASAGVYIAETSEPTYRAFLLALIILNSSLGIFLVHLTGTFLSWRVTALICAFFALPAQIIILFVKESPSWLLSKGKVKEATKSFQWCRGDSEEANREFVAMLSQTKEKTEKDKFLFKNLFVPEFLKPLGIICVYMTANQWTGVNAMPFYYVRIMKDTIGGDINEYLAVLVVDFVRVVMSFVGSGLLKRYNRRPLGIISGFGAAASLLALSCYTYLITAYPTARSGYILIVFFISYMIFMCIGFQSLPWSLMGELFALKVRSIGNGLSTCVSFLALLSVVETIPDLLEKYDVSGVFLIFGLVALVSTIFVCLALPETKGKTLQQIEEEFKGKKDMHLNNSPI